MMKTSKTHVNYHIDTKLIYVDSNFNCRGRIDMTQISDIASSIKTHGLQIPIIVWERDNLPGDYQYLLIAGHRRFQACTEILLHKTILATVRTDLTPETARILNFTENLERRNLNILEEAKAIAIAFPKELTNKEVGSKLNRSVQWIKTRRILVNLPESAQNAAARGQITIEDILLIHSVPPEFRARLTDKIIDARKHGRSISYEVHVKRGCACHVKPSNDDIKLLMLHLTERGLKGLCIKILSYVLGRLSPENLYYYINHLTSDELQTIIDREDVDVDETQNPIKRTIRKNTKRGCNQSEQDDHGGNGICGDTAQPI